MTPSAPVLVVGDAMLDRYWEGLAERLSPEAPVPVLRLGREWQRPGGAANVAMNLAALDCRTTLATVLGLDEAGSALEHLLDRAGIELLAVRRADCRTTLKIRAVCQRQQLLRVDVEQAVPRPGAVDLADRVHDRLPAFRWVLLSDYAKGALADPAGLIRRAAAHGCRVLVDPKGEDFARYRGAWLLKPNQAEVERVVGAATDDADFDARMLALRQALQVEHLLVTRGAAGMVLYSPQRAPRREHARAREVFDVSGAGDTALAVLAAALAAGDTLDDALSCAHRAAALVVGKFGVATVSRRELAQDRLHEGIA